MQKWFTQMREKGSALVGAVALSIIIAIAGIGFIQVSASSINNENSFLQNEQAFQAAESGISLALTWLSMQATFPGIGSVTDPYTSNPLVIGTMKVYDTITPLAGGKASVSATVYNGTTFMKRVRISDVSAQSVNKFTTYYNDFYDNSGAGGLPNWGGFRGFEFNGRFHFNTCFIRIDRSGGPSGAHRTIFRDGLVTVARNAKNPLVDGNSLGRGCGQQLYSSNHPKTGTAQMGHLGNNYDNGIDATANFVWKGLNPLNVSELDSVFTDHYQSEVDPITMSSIKTTGSNISTVGYTRYSLAASTDHGSEENNYRPTLTFSIISGSSAAIYEYVAAGVTKRDTIYYNSGSVFVSPNNLNVRGVVRGKISVATDSGKDICPVGNLTVEGYDVNNTDKAYGVPVANTNIIGLASGKNFKLNDKWKHKNKAGTADTIEQVTGTNNLVHITASMMALDSTAANKGCFYINDDGVTALHYGLKISGNQIMQAYKSTRYGLAGTSPTDYYTLGLAENPFIVNLDSRFTEGNMIPPGFPLYMKTVDSDGVNRMVLSTGNWSEENVR